MQRIVANLSILQVQFRYHAESVWKVQIWEEYAQLILLDFGGEMEKYSKFPRVKQTNEK